VPAIEALKRLPLVGGWRRRRHHRFFLSDAGYGCHLGIYRSFAEARKKLPQTKEFDRREFTHEYIENRSRRVYAFDYPVMLWMKDAFGRGARIVFDIGGSVGNHFYAYRKFLDYPSGLHWHVYELPASIEAGREFASRNGAMQLGFSPIAELHRGPADIWLAAGAIEFIEHGRPNVLLAGCPHRPQHILLNKLPLYDGEDYVSTQNIGGGAFAPHHVYNRARLIFDIEAMGYRLIDAWEVSGWQLSLLGHPEKTIPRYSGLYFRACEGGRAADQS
jgi:putative methyltransferase (TIGR04325 family)